MEAGVGTGASEGAIHLVVAHHGKGRCVGAGDGDGRAQGRSCKEAGINGKASREGAPSSSNPASTLEPPALTVLSEEPTLLAPTCIA